MITRTLRASEGACRQAPAAQQRRRHALPHAQQRRCRRVLPRAAAADGGEPVPGALVLEADGVLLDVHMEGHRVAFNRAFHELGYDCASFSAAVYHDLLGKGDGTGEGLVSCYYNTVGWPSFLPTSEQARAAAAGGAPAAGAGRLPGPAARGLTAAPRRLRRRAAAQAVFAGKVCALKQQQLQKMLAANEVKLRDGVARVLCDAVAAGARLALVAHTASEPADDVVGCILRQLPPDVAAAATVYSAAPQEQQGDRDGDGGGAGSLDSRVAAAKQRGAQEFVAAMSSALPGGKAAGVPLGVAGLAAGSSPAASPAWLAAVAATLGVPVRDTVVVASGGALVSAAAAAGMVAVAVPRSMAAAATYPGAAARFEAMCVAAAGSVAVGERLQRAAAVPGAAPSPVPGDCAPPPAVAPGWAPAGSGGGTGGTGTGTSSGSGSSSSSGSGSGSGSGAAASAPGGDATTATAPTTASLGPLLVLSPRELEDEFWRSDATARLLFGVDLAACALALPNSVAGALRLPRGMPQHVLAAPGVRAVLAFMFGGFLGLAALPLVLMAVRRRQYTSHRHALILSSRLFRLLASLALVHPATLVGFLTQANLVRTAAAGGSPLRALLLNSLQPTFFFFMQAHLLLPLRVVVPVQLASFAGASLWAAMFPCWLPLPGAPGSGGGAAELLLAPVPAERAAELQALAERWCARLGGMMSWIGAVAGLPAPARARGGTCAGAAAFQMLHLATAAVLLVAVPVGSVYALERHLKLRFLCARRVALACAPRGRCCWWALALCLGLYAAQLPWLVSRALLHSFGAVDCAPLAAAATAAAGAGA
ncbi:hypothetical protein HT031_005843 [Scenedesmus sp. PABB004]|nr:hypothetical protein HT031_005843 [Scenedesmus sp. PABB004]